MSDGAPEHAWRHATKAHWAAEGKPRRMRSSSSALRQQVPEHALLDVLCRRRLIARVIDTAIPNLLNVWAEATPGACNIIEVASAPIIVDCRCNKPHELDPQRIRELASQQRPGRPLVVTVADVSIR